VSETEHLNSHQRDTLAAVFRHPTSHNIEWHDVLSLLNAVGTVRETAKGHIEVVIDGKVEVLEPTRHKEIDADQVAILRRLLRSAGYDPQGSDT
jgi:predicted Zn-dependent protease